MTKPALKLTGGTACLLALAASAFADIKLNENFSVGGYGVGSYQYTKVSDTPATDRFDIDAVKTIFTASFKPVTGVFSFYYPGTSGSDVTVLDAYATYDMGSGYSVTAGKFLSYLGYEAFDPVNMTQITYGAPTVGSMFSIPAYHTGVRLDYGGTASSFGIAALDSVYSPTSIFKGDGELMHNAGFEAFYKFTGVKDLVLFFSAAYDMEGGFQPHSVLTLDIWAQYAINANFTVAAEYADTDGGDGKKGTSWLLFLSYASGPHWSCIFRVSGDDPDESVAASDYLQYTICPTYKFTDNLSARAEYSYYDYDMGGKKDFFGVQVLFKF